MSRETAYQVLRSGSQAPMREVSRYAERAGLDDRDRGLARAIVGTEVRRRATLRAVVSVFARGNPSAEVATILRLGAAQMLFLDTVPDHAAISETVRLASNHVSLARGGYVNGVLRSIQRARRDGHIGDPCQDVPGTNWHFLTPVFRDPETHPLLWAEDALSIPSNLLKRWKKRWGMEKAVELATTYLSEPDLSVVAFEQDRSAAIAAFPELEFREATHERIALSDSSNSSVIINSETFQGGQITIQGEPPCVRPRHCNANGESGYWIFAQRRVERPPILLLRVPTLPRGHFARPDRNDGGNLDPIESRRARANSCFGWNRRSTA